MLKEALLMCSEEVEQRLKASLGLQQEWQRRRGSAGCWKVGCLQV